MSIFELIHKGGLLMIPILLCSVFALGIIVERMMWAGLALISILLAIFFHRHRHQLYRDPEALASEWE